MQRYAEEVPVLANLPCYTVMFAASHYEPVQPVPAHPPHVVPAPTQLLRDLHVAHFAASVQEASLRAIRATTISVPAPSIGSAPPSQAVANRPVPAPVARAAAVSAQAPPIGSAPPSQAVANRPVPAPVARATTVRAQAPPIGSAPPSQAGETRPVPAQAHPVVTPAVSRPIGILRSPAGAVPVRMVDRELLLQLRQDSARHSGPPRLAVQPSRAQGVYDGTGQSRTGTPARR